MKIYITGLLCVLFVVSCCITKAKKNNPQLFSFTKETTIYDYENEILDSSQLFKRENSNDVFINFFGEFNDTVVFKINGKERMRWNIYTTDYPSTSSANSGVDYGIRMEKWVRDISIELLRQKVYIPLVLNKKYPLYVLYRIGKTWHISGRRKILIIK